MPQTVIHTNINDFVTIEKDYIKKISTENTLLEIAVNGFMMSEKVPQEVKEEIIQSIGSRWFHKDEINKTIFWDN